MGNIVIPGSTNPEHIRANLDIFDFELSTEEMEKINKLNNATRYYIPNDELEEHYADYHIDLDSQE